MGIVCTLSEYHPVILTPLSSTMTRLQIPITFRLMMLNQQKNRQIELAVESTDQLSYILPSGSYRWSVHRAAEV